jgi:hypothetical protein
MTDTDDPKPVGKTRWRRVPLVLVPAYAAIAGLIFLAASGTLAVSFAISGTQFTTTADSLTSTGTDSNGQAFYQFGVVNFTGTGTPTTVAQTEAVIPHASLTNLCQSVTIGPITLPGGLVVGPFTSVTKAGGGTTPVTATDLVTDTSILSADNASFTNFRVGQDLGTFASPPSVPVARGSGPNVVAVPAPLGTFSQTAGSVSITKLRSTGNATSASSFTVPNLSVQFGTAC